MTQVAFAAALGPALVQVTVPFTVVPAGGFGGKPVSVTCMSATGFGEIARVSTLFAGTGSAVSEPAVVVMLSAPLPGAGKVLVHVITAPTGNGSLAPEQLCTAPAGKPLSEQVGVAAALGPLLVQVPLTVTGCPAVAEAGIVVTATISASGTTPTDCCATLLPGTGSAVEEPAVPVTVTPPLTGAVKLTEQTIAEPNASEATGCTGTQTTVAPDGTPATAQVALAAALGPSLVQVTVPVTAYPALGLAGKPVTVARMSACGTISIGFTSMLLFITGSAVVEPAVVVMFNGPLAGATNVLLQTIEVPIASGLGATLGRQVCVAPAGSPLNTHVGAAAGLGPRFVHVPETLTDCPAVTLPPAGTVVTARMSACGTTATGVCAELLVLSGSVVLDAAVATTVTVPVAGATKLTSHVIAAPTARVGSGVAGKQTTVAPGGKPATVHVAFAAALGPLLAQLIVPITVLPAGAVAGMPEIVATISALGDMVINFVSTLLLGLLSWVRLPATVLTEIVPLAGATNVAVQVITPEGAANVAGMGSGAQVCDAPGGNPTSLHVGVVAMLGPKFVQVPLTVTDCPAITVAGAVVCACMSAIGTMPTDCCEVLFAGTGSLMLLAAVPVIVTSTFPPGGAVKLTLQTIL